MLREASRHLPVAELADTTASAGVDAPNDSSRFSKGDATAKHGDASANWPRQRGRGVPAVVRRSVFERDGHRCAYVDERGVRCRETERLELHHHDPFALGGPPTTENLPLYYSAHNALAAERDFGRDSVLPKREERSHSLSGRFRASAFQMDEPPSGVVLRATSAVVSFLSGRVIGTVRDAASAWPRMERCVPHAGGTPASGGARRAEAEPSTPGRGAPWRAGAAAHAGSWGPVGRDGSGAARSEVCVRVRPASGTGVNESGGGASKA